MWLVPKSKVWEPAPNPHSAARRFGVGLLFSKLYKRTEESYKAVNAILHLALCRLLQASTGGWRGSREMVRWCNNNMIIMFMS